VPASKSTRAQVDDAIGMLEARSEVDKDLANLNGNSDAFRLSEGMAFVEAMNQTFAETLIYGNTAVNPERFTGLAARYSSLSAGNGANIVDAGGTGSDNTSIWLVVWGENTITGIYPKGSHRRPGPPGPGRDRRLRRVNNRYRALAELWKWKGGLTLRDWRYVVRIANINVSDLVGQTGTQASTAATAIMKLMVKAMARIPFMGMGTPVFYAGRTVKEMLAIAALDKSQNALGIDAALQQFGTSRPASPATAPRASWASRCAPSIASSKPKPAWSKEHPHDSRHPTPVRLGAVHRGCGRRRGLHQHPRHRRRARRGHRRGGRADHPHGGGGHLRRRGHRAVRAADGHGQQLRHGDGRSSR
jgi:hypothetical protein